MRTDIAVVLDHESALTFAIIVLYHYGPLRIEKTIFDGHRVLNPQSRDWLAIDLHADDINPWSFIK